MKKALLGLLTLGVVATGMAYSAPAEARCVAWNRYGHCVQHSRHWQRHHQHYGWRHHHHHRHNPYYAYGR